MGSANVAEHYVIDPASGTKWRFDPIGYGEEVKEVLPAGHSTAYVTASTRHPTNNELTYRVYRLEVIPFDGEIEAYQVFPAKDEEAIGNYLYFWTPMESVEVGDPVCVYHFNFFPGRRANDITCFEHTAVPGPPRSLREVSNSTGLSVSSMFHRGLVPN